MTVSLDLETHPDLAALTAPDTQLPEIVELAELLTYFNVTSVGELMVELAVVYQNWRELLGAARATIAAADTHTRYEPTAWLREFLTARDLMPEAGAHPTRYMPLAPEDAAWGRH